MLEIKNINISIACNDRKLFENFSFVLNKEDKVAIIGEEGNGKSTLLKYIYNSELIDNFCNYSGKIISKGKIGYLPQFISEKSLDYTLKDFFANIDIAESYDIFTKLGLNIDLIKSNQIIKTLSGGEKIKIQLVKILSKKPDILLLDEPTNDIDIDTLLWLEKFINTIKIPIMYISHDEKLIENTANVIIHIEQLVRKTKPKVTVAYETYSEYIENRNLIFNKHTQIANKQRSDYDKKMQELQSTYNSVKYDQDNISRGNPSGGRLLKKKMKNVLSQKRRFEREKESFLEIPQMEEAILTKFDEDISIPNGKIILDFKLEKLKIDEKILSENINLFVKGREHIGIIGKNGAGKTTLINLIWENLKNRKDIIPYYMPQNYYEILDYEKTPIDFLNTIYTKEEMTKARTYMGSMKFTHEEMTNKIKNLSGGQKAKILFLDMVIKKANVLILDEPTRNFSPLSAPVIRNNLSLFNGTIISISHDRKYLEDVCDSVYKLSKNGLIKQDNNLF